MGGRCYGTLARVSAASDCGVFIGRSAFCRVDRGGDTSERLQRLHREWAEENGIRAPLNGKETAEKLRAMGCKPKKIGTASQRGWGGIRERQPEDEDATPDGTDGTDANPENPYERNTELDFSRMTSVLTCPVREDGEPGCFDDLLDPSGGYAS